MIKLDKIKNLHLVGDLHFGIRSNSSEWLNIQLDFWRNYFIPTIIKTSDYNKDEDTLFLMGDIFHSREFLNIKVLYEAQKLFKELSGYFNKVIIILGNHDLFNKSTTEINSVKQFELLSTNIHVIESYDILEINNNKFFMMPYEHDYEKFENIINEYSKDCEYLLCHADIQNMKFDKSRIIDQGLNLKNIRKFKKIFSGHIHYRQEKDWVVYTGIPYAMERSDCNNQKGWYTLKFTGNNFKEEFIENKYSPVFIKTNLHDLIELSLEESESLLKNNLVDIYVDNKYSGKFIISQFLELIKDFKIRKIDFFPYDSEKNIEINDALKNVDIKNLNTFDAVNLFLDSIKVDTDTKTIVSNYFEKLYKEASEMNKNLIMSEE